MSVVLLCDSANPDAHAPNSSKDIVDDNHPPHVVVVLIPKDTTIKAERPKARPPPS